MCPLAAPNPATHPGQRDPHVHDLGRGQSLDDDLRRLVTPSGEHERLTSTIPPWPSPEREPTSHTTGCPEPNHFTGLFIHDLSLAAELPVRGASTDSPGRISVDQASNHGPSILTS